MKVAEMARQISMQETYLESITYQITKMSKKEADMQLGDIIALLKANCSKVYEYCARETTMIFGGNSMYANGPGKRIVDAVQFVKAYQIPAGAEDVMDDFAGKMIFKRSKL
jgi:hypothetical protein